MKGQASGLISHRISQRTPGALALSAALAALLPLPGGTLAASPDSPAAAPQAAKAGTSSTAIVIVDDDGRSIALPAPARRVITLAPHATELVYAAGGGDRLVATVASSDYPPAARALPRVGLGMTINAESLAAHAPDLVIGWRTGRMDPAATALARLGTPLFVSAPGTLADIPGTLERFGGLLGTQAVAQPAADALRTRLATLAARYAHKPPVRVFVQIGERPLYTLNGTHIVSDMLRTCGAVNVFADLALPAPQVSEESVLAARPDAVLLGAGPDTPRLVQAWQARGLPAAVSGHAHALDPDTLWRPGPRMVDAAEALCPLLDAARHRDPP